MNAQPAQDQRRDDIHSVMSDGNGDGADAALAGGRTAKGLLSAAVVRD